MGYIGQAPANKAITSADIEDGVVSAADLGANSVDSSELVDGSVDTSHIGALQVTGAKLNTDVISAQTALGATPADTDELLVSDAGVLKRVDYSYLKGITAANFRPNANPLWMNGDMAIAQRSTSVASVATGYNTVDRYITRNTTGGTWTQTQEALTSGDAFEDGFSTAIKMDCTTANASLSAGSQLWVEQKIEGQDLQLLKKGTANAEKITFGFWVKATKTGTNILNIYDADNDRQCSIAYTINSTNTWEKKIVNFPADTTGALGNDNGASFRIFFLMAMGTNATSGTLQTTWAAYVGANWAVGQVNNADSTSNNFHITGVQLEVGEYTSSTIPPFQHESYGENLKRCERYFQQNPSVTGPAYAIVATGFSYGTTNVYITWNLRTTMRATPSFATTSNWSIFYASTAQSYTPSFASDHSGPDCITVQDASLGSSVTAGQPMLLRQNNSASARLKMDAEL